MRDALGRVNRVALIGGTSDIGLAAVRRLVGDGALDVVLLGRSEERMRSATSDLAASVSFLPVDLAATDDHAASIDELFSGGDVDVAIFAAGRLDRDPSADDAVAMAEVNFVGTLSLMVLAAEAMRHQGHGQLVILSSAGVTRPRPSNYLYGAGKAALDFAARGLATDLEGTEVVVTIVRPGFVHTKMTAGMDPSPLSSTPEAVAEAIAGAVRDRRGDVVWVPGPIRILAAVLGIVPAPVLRRLDT